MEPLGLILGFFINLFISLLILAGWPLLSLLALAGLRRRQLPESARAVWVLVILAVPFLGALAFWFVGSGSGRRAQARARVGFTARGAWGLRPSRRMAGSW